MDSVSVLLWLFWIGGCNRFGLVSGLVCCFGLFGVCGMDVADLGLLWLHVEFPWSHVGFPWASTNQDVILFDKKLGWKGGYCFGFWAETLMLTADPMVSTACFLVIFSSLRIWFRVSSLTKASTGIVVSSITATSSKPACLIWFR